MDRTLIESLIAALEASALTELEYSRDGTTLRLVKGAATPHHGHAHAPDAAPPAQARARPVPLSAPPSGTVCAPLYGIVHLQRTPGTPPFVAVGQAVEADQVLCTIEAMKVFTDIRAPRPGTVAAILAADAQEVEAGQPLVRIA